MPRKEPPLNRDQKAYVEAFERMIRSHCSDDVGGVISAREDMAAGLEAMSVPKPGAGRPLYRTGEHARRRRDD